MKTILIKGKPYVTVAERVREFHKLYPEGCITTQITSNDEKRVIVQATVNITTEKPFQQIVFTGHSQAEWGKGIMGAVALEVAETSAVGRALGFAGIGLLEEGSIASADEVRKNKTEDLDSPPF